MIDLKYPGTLAKLSKQLKNEIDKYCADKYDDGPRSHLGSSEIGHNCSKYLWLKFRWTFHKHHDGRQQRLFQRGHFEEPRFCGYLESVGFKVILFDEEAIARGETDKGKMQIRISACKGHFGGSIDGMAEREDFGKVLCEFKTKGTGKGFIELKEKGCKAKAPQHFSQQSIYGYKLGLKYSIYMAVNKNDDDLHIEVLELDHNLGADLERKAEMIIFSQEPPNGVSCSPAYFECSWCDAKDVCYSNAKPLVNCRSCKRCKPVEDAAWFCEHWQAIVPSKEAIFVACPEWESII